MTSTGSTEFTATSEIQSVWSRAARLLRGRVGLVALGAAVLGIGGALNWHWLVAAGVAPLILSVLPCVSCARWDFAWPGWRTALATLSSQRTPIPRFFLQAARPAARPSPQRVS